MRQFMRHPADIPITVVSQQGQHADTLNDISYGGLRFISDTAIPNGSLIKIRIDIISQACEVDARVVWCRHHEGRYELGVVFIDQQVAFKMRMVEQVCNIEHYRNLVLRKEGRQLDSKQAAMEWIARHAAQFPGPDSTH